MPGRLPDELRDRLTKQFGAGTLATMEKAFLTERKTTFRVNTLKATDEEIMNVFREEQVQYERVKNIPHAFLMKKMTDRELLEHPLAVEGKIYLQGISSMIPPLVMLDEASLVRTANLRILDMCAAPGSKTSQIAALVGPPSGSPHIWGEGSPRIVACEDNEVRYQKLLNTLRTQGATSVDARNVDATLLHHEMPEYFDLILTDVPCSAEGRFDLNNRRSYEYWSEKNITAHAKLQRRLLRSAVQCLKPGGTLVYSTCTLAPEENEDMIGWLLTEFPSMTPQAITLPVQNVRPTAHKTATVLPTPEMEGFFVAKLIKRT